MRGLHFFHREERLRRQAARWFVKLRESVSTRDRRAFDRWYASSPEHAEAYDRICASWGEASLLRTSPIARGRGLPEPRRPVRWSGYAAAAAVVGVGSVSLVALVQSQRSSLATQMFLVSTNVGEIREVPLADGSRVTLDTDTSVAVDFDTAERNVTLRRGRARFAIAAERRPFAVRAGNASVSAESGVVDVSLSESGVATSAVAGTHRVVLGGADEPAGAPAAVEVTEGMRAVLSSSAGGARTSRVAQPDRWPEGMLDFTATPLSEAVAQANRYSVTKIRLMDRSIAALRVTGGFRAGDMEGLARALQAAFDLRIERASNGDYLLHPRRRGSRPH